jgi:hypothetical protein
MAEMRKFEHFGPKVYLFGSHWAFRVAFGGCGWETAVPHTDFSAGSLPNGLKIACVSHHFLEGGACEDALRSRGAGNGRARLETEQLHM